MKAPSKALLLIGSPKPDASTSGSLGTYLLEELEKQGVTTETVKLTRSVRSDEAMEELAAAIADTDLVVLACPLYWDSLPAHVVRVFERLAVARAGVSPIVGVENGDRPAFVTVVQGGFPEAEQNLVALRICRHFADAAGFEWAGGLAMGGGGVVESLPLRRIAGRVRAAVKALDLTAAALATGRPVPDEAVALMAKPPFPPVVVRWMGNMGLRRRYKKEGDGRGLRARPSASPPTQR
jgi:NAD(P)H-dependent FMN reductase